MAEWRGFVVNFQWSPFPRNQSTKNPEKSREIQEDVNGEKLTVKKWWIFGADFFHGLVPIFSRFTPIFHGL